MNVKRGAVKRFLAKVKIGTIDECSNPDHWKLEHHGEPPHFLGQGLDMNFRPRCYPTTGGRAFAEEMIEKIRRFREQQSPQKGRGMNSYDAHLQGGKSNEPKDENPWNDMQPGYSLQGKHPQQVDYSGGKAASSKIPPLHLIPTVALEKTAERFQLGIERKGDKSWNAISQNQEVLTDLDFLIERTAHIIHHAAKLRDKLVRLKADRDTPETVKQHHDPMTQIDKDDDASAIVWGGMFLQCAVEALREGR